MKRSKWSSMMDYKYTVLNGGKSRVYVGIGWRYRCLIGVVLTVVFLVGVYFLVHGLSNHSYRTKPSSHNKQKVLLISIDGFRYNLRNKTSTPNLDWFVKNGVSVDHVFNVFPTITLPNHQSIVTGLYPENHGILGNKMYDRVTKESFYMSNNQSYFWKDGTPIWIENELQGYHSGVCFWPGYDVLFNGKQPKYLPNKSYTNPLASHPSTDMPYEMRVDLVIDWLKKDDVNFVALYIDEPDETEHEVGPDPSDKEGLLKLQKIIKKVDMTIGKLMRRIKQESLESHVNVIIVGDHGQTNTDRLTKVIDLQKYVNLTKDADFFGDGYIYAKPNRTESIYKKLKQAEKEEGHFKVYLKKDIPENLHVRNNKRTGDIMYLPDPGWTLWTYNPLNRNKINAGTHGYINTVKDMNPAFFGYGPLFRTGYKEDVIYTVDLYSLMCHILQIKPRSNDGEFDRIKSILKEYS